MKGSLKACLDRDQKLRKKKMNGILSEDAFLKSNFIAINSINQ